MDEELVFDEVVIKPYTAPTYEIDIKKILFWSALFGLGAYVVYQDEKND